MISIKRLEAILRGDPKVAPKSNLEHLLHSIKDTSGGTDELTVQSIVSAAVADLVNEAPEELDTFKELADWISSHEETYSALTALVSEKQDIADMSNYATLSAVDEAISSALSEFTPPSVDLTNYMSIDDLSGYVSFGEELDLYISVFLNEHDVPGVVYESTLSEALSDYLFQSDLEGYLSSTDLDGADSLEVYVTNMISDYIDEHVTMEALFQDYLSQNDLEVYLSNNGYLTSNELSDLLSGYVTLSELSDYLSQDALNDYLSQSDLEDYLSDNASEIASMLQSYLTT